MNGRWISGWIDNVMDVKIGDEMKMHTNINIHTHTHTHTNTHTHTHINTQTHTATWIALFPYSIHLIDAKLVDSAQLKPALKPEW